MRSRSWLVVGLLFSPLTLPALLTGAGTETPKITWKKTVIDPRFLSEGVAIADVNKDGKTDILNGEFWYEAPTWKPHRIRPGKDDYREGDKNVYSQSFACWTEDLNGDTWPDLIVIGFPGAPCHWFENPQGKEGMWKQHLIWHSACNETPLYVDLFGTGRRVLIMGWQPKGKDHEGQMAWFAPGKDPTQPWEMHPISEPSTPEREIPGTFRFAHGLGVGDINGDGRLDVMCTSAGLRDPKKGTGGWWEQPARDDGRPWKFHPAPFHDAVADMHTLDIDGDGRADVVSSSAHQYGIWWHQQRPGKDGSPDFLRRDLFPRLVSQTHALHLVDINGDGLKDLVTGKRWWAHGPKGDADPNAPAKIYWFEARRGSDGLITFTPHEIDDDSGIGTQFVVADFNGDRLLDVVVSNKKGTFLIEQVRK
ncbi:MAG TPA: VCBS repeat-containing protein [Gemmataceae bacterium]|nr:VCBS repeat-containing protein [Gemmataceae bacterium]